MLENAAAPWSLLGAFGSGSVTAKKVFLLSTLRITTKECPVEFTSVRLHLLERADELILGLPFTDGVGFASDHI